jgi:hypothetical protein
MVDEIDIWRAADVMRKMFGADAAIHSAMRADKLMDEGDAEGFNMWWRVAAAINELERSAPRDGEAEH